MLNRALFNKTLVSRKKPVALLQATMPLSTYDPGQGFHDIKPLADFHPWPFWVIWFTALLFLALIFYYFWRRRKQSEVVISVAVPPEITALRRLDELSVKRKSCSIESRELAAEISLVVRGYLEAACGFPAVEQTTAEVKASLRCYLRSEQTSTSDRPVSVHRNQVLEDSLHKLLRFTDRATFCEKPDEEYPLLSEDFSNALLSAQSIVQGIHQMQQLVLSLKVAEGLSSSNENDLHNNMAPDVAPKAERSSFAPPPSRGD